MSTEIIKKCNTVDTTFQNKPKKAYNVHIATEQNKTASIIMPFYISMLGPLLAHCVQFWSPVLKKDTKEIEKEPKKKEKATKIMNGPGHPTS